MNKKIILSIFLLIALGFIISFVYAGFTITERATDANTRCYSNNDCSDLICVAMPGNFPPPPKDNFLLTRKL